jgi:hypothetical protein
MTTRQIIKDSILEELIKEKRCYHIHKMLVKEFKKFEGKKITKRMVTALKEVMPGWVIYLRIQYGQIHVAVWEHSSNDKEEYFLGYTTGDHGGIYREGKADVSHSGFEYYSCRTGEACLIRINRAEKMLADGKELTKIAKQVDAFKRAEEKLKAIRYDYRYAAWKKLGLKG